MYTRDKDTNSELYEAIKVASKAPDDATKRVNTVDMEKWIDRSQLLITDEDTDESDWVILVDDLRELFKTHTLVPNEPTEAMFFNGMAPRGYTVGGFPNSHGIRDTYKAMLKAAQEN